MVERVAWFWNVLRPQIVGDPGFDYETWEIRDLGWESITPRKSPCRLECRIRRFAKSSSRNRRLALLIPDLVKVWTETM